MGKTFLELKTEVAEALKDPGFLTFTDSMLEDLVNVAISDVSNVIPRSFQEDLTPVEDETEYVLLGDDFDDTATPEIEVMRVELWDTSQTPNARLRNIKPASAGYVADSQVGWVNWGGTLQLPRWVATSIGSSSDRLIRVWGYAPYPQLDDDADVFAGGVEAQWAVVQRAQYEGLKRLINDRNLFAQWQARSGNADTSLAGLMNERNGALEEWRRTKRELLRLRAPV